MQFLPTSDQLAAFLTKFSEVCSRSTRRYTTGLGTHSAPKGAHRPQPRLVSGPIVALASRALGGREIANIFWLAVGDGSGKIGFFIANLLLARVLHPAQYGIFVLAQSLIYYAWQATDLGTTMYGIREMARNKGNATRTTASLLGLRVSAGLIGTLACLIGLALWPLPKATKLIFAGASLYLTLRPLYLDFALKGLERFRTLAIGSIAAGAVFLGFADILVRGPSGAALATFLWSLSWLFGSVVLALYLRWGAKVQIKISFQLGSWVAHIRHSVHFALAGGLLLVYDTLPIVLVGIVYGSNKLGLFSAVYRLIITLTGAGFLVPMALYPTLSESHAKDIDKFIELHRRLRNLMLIGGGGGAIVGVIFAAPAVALLLGSEYHQAVPIFRILSVDLLCYAARFTYGTCLSASGHQKLYMLVSILGLAVLSAAFFPATTHWGLQGAAISVVLGDAVVALALAGTLHRKITRNHAPALYRASARVSS